ncbi:fumarylacetoacetase [Pricia sp. S334]|uniref:fumarylacetoacetase n=1 Tax=Pricia mediterranea TaxID=3076079 RepID=A0ABU3L0K9_9FLAO|nr:fumarylacetoacetase [Pricia sp. S334]MDT7827118.1 fumarylacetoacetase [Pricia sp. S334]
MDKRLTSWVEIPNNSDFSIHNLPFGIFSVGSGAKKLGIAIGDQVVDLYAVANLGYFDDIDLDKQVFLSDQLNDFISLGKPVTNTLRLKVQDLLSDDTSPLKEDNRVLVPQSEVEMHLPVRIGDYTDFYSSIEHATNVGKMFRDPENALLPNWKHLPVGYHGRASSIMVSGRNIVRPKGQILPPDADTPVYRPSSRLDFELEMGFIIGKKTQVGESITTSDAENHIFGKVLFNDWSARDIQKWEYVPLGPFLGKSFASSISPWVVTLEALEPFKVAGPEQDPEVLPYLNYYGAKNYDINLEVGLRPRHGEENMLSRSNFKYMYWNMAQQLAHHTCNGCNVNVGDILASGTISGKNPNSYGSMLELAWGGKKPITLSNGEKRTFLEDYDTVTMRGYCLKNGIRVGFGEVKAQILPVVD